MGGVLAGSEEACGVGAGRELLGVEGKVEKKVVRILNLGIIKQ